MKTVLVTGGAGFIGTHTCISLLEAGYDVVLLDNLCNAHPDTLTRLEQITGRSLPFYLADVRDTEVLRQIFRSHAICAVLHFAGLKAVSESIQQPLTYYQNNVYGTMQLLQVMEEFHCHTLVFSSSATVYGTQHTAPYAECLPLSSNNPYGETKIVIEQLLHALCAADASWQVAALRYFNPIGSHESGLIGEQPQGIPSNIAPYLALVASGELPFVSIYGADYSTPDGTGIRDYIHVMDLAEGHVSALEYIRKHPGFSAFNLGSGKGYSVLELLQTYAQVSGQEIPYHITDRRKGDVAVSYADVHKAQKLLHWQAKRSLQQMCQDSWRYITQNKGEEPHADHSL